MIDVHYASLTSQGVQHWVFYLHGHPSRYQPRPTGLNFGEQTGTGVFPLVIRNVRSNYLKGNLLHNIYHCPVCYISYETSKAEEQLRVHDNVTCFVTPIATLCIPPSFSIAPQCYTMHCLCTLVPDICAV